MIHDVIVQIVHGARSAGEHKGKMKVFWKRPETICGRLYASFEILKIIVVKMYSFVPPIGYYIYCPLRALQAIVTFLCFLDAP